jgi:hypothetical protein
MGVTDQEPAPFDWDALTLAPRNSSPLFKFRIPNQDESSRAAQKLSMLHNN